MSIDNRLRRTASAGRQRGFSLVEVMVATLILTLVFVGLYGAFSFGFATVKIAQEDLGADRVMVQKLETLRMYDWSKITGGYIPTNSTSSFYSVDVAVNPVPLSESYSNSLRQVSVSASWISGGVTRRRSMTTLVSQNGIQTFKP